METTTDNTGTNEPTLTPEEQETIRMNGAEIARHAEELHAELMTTLTSRPVQSVMMVLSSVYAGAVAQFAKLQLEAEIERAPAGVVITPEAREAKEMLIVTNELGRFSTLVKQNRESLKSNIIAKA